jgi:hypothetical protein
LLVNRVRQWMEINKYKQSGSGSVAVAVCGSVHGSGSVTVAASGSGSVHGSGQCGSSVKHQASSLKPQASSVKCAKLQVCKVSSGSVSKVSKVSKIPKSGCGTHVSGWFCSSSMQKHCRVVLIAIS